MLCSSAHAADYLTATVTSYHFDRAAVEKRNLSEFNPGIGFEREDSKVRKMVGVYYNSHQRISAYGLLGYMPIVYGGWSAGMTCGLLTGYKYTITPALGGLVTYQHNDVGINVMIAPPVPEFNVIGFVGFQLRFKI